jgi:hypothetical protein
MSRGGKAQPLHDYSLEKFFVKKTRPVVQAVGQHKALYVDGNNFLGQWLGLGKRDNLDGITFPMLYTQCLDCLEANIEDFMSHARCAGWVVSVFFDNFKKVIHIWHSLGMKNLQFSMFLSV